MKHLEEKLKNEHTFQEAEFLPASKKYTSYLQNSVYLVQKEGLRGVVAAGAARISELLKCNISTKEEIEKLTKGYCTYLCSTFSDYPATELNFPSKDNKCEPQTFYETSRC